MTWEAAAAIAETAGAIGVIASLIYVPIQVRNENRASAVAAKLESTKLLSSASYFQLRKKTLSDDDWAEFYAILRFWLESAGVHTWWQNIGRARFSGEFVRFIDGEFEKIAFASTTSSAGESA